MKELRRIGAVLWLASLAAMTLVPGRVPDAAVSSFGCVVCGSRASADAVLNVVLFLPLGFLLARRPNALLRAAVAGIVLSFAIECAQILLPGRQAAVADIVWNGVGSALGVGIYRLVRANLLAGSPPPARVGTVAALVAGLTVAGTGWLLEPSPTADPYWGHLTPTFGGMPRYGGTLLEARLDGRAIPQGRFPPDRDPQGALLGDWSVEALVEIGPPPRGVSPIVNIGDDRQREIVLLGASGYDLVWRERLRAAALRFDQPDLRVAGGLGSFSVGDTVRLGVRRAGSDRCIAVDEVETCGHMFTPGRGWSILLQAERLSEPQRRYMDVVWLIALFFPVGFFSPGRLAVAGNGLVAALLVAASVLLTRLAAGPIWEVAGALGGLLSGRGAVRVRRPRPPSPPTTDPRAGT